MKLTSSILAVDPTSPDWKLFQKGLSTDSLRSNWDTKLDLFSQKNETSFLLEEDSRKKAFQFFTSKPVLTGHIQLASEEYHNDYPAYLKVVKERILSEIGQDGVEKKNSPSAWENFLSLHLLFLDKSENNEQTLSILQLSTEALAGYVECLKKMDRIEQLESLAHHCYRVSQISGLLLEQLKKSPQVRIEKEILRSLQDAYRCLHDHIPYHLGSFQYIKKFANAQLLKIDLALTPPTSSNTSSLRSRLYTYQKSLQTALEAFQTNSPLKDEFVPLIRFDLNLLHDIPTDLEMTRSFITHQSALIITQLCSEIDLKKGVPFEEVKNRYENFSKEFLMALQNNPHRSFEEILKDLNSATAQEIKSKIQQFTLLKEWVQIDRHLFESNPLLQNPDDQIKLWVHQITHSIQTHNSWGSQFFSSEDCYFNSYYQILLHLGSPDFRAHFLEATGYHLLSESAIFNEIDGLKRELQSWNSKVKNGIHSTLQIGNFAFLAFGSWIHHKTLQKIFSFGNIEGNLSLRGTPLIQQGRLTSVGIASSSMISSAFMSLGLALPQYVEDLSQHHAWAHQNFLKSFVLGSIVQFSMLGASQMGQRLLRTHQAKTIQALPSSVEVNSWQPFKLHTSTWMTEIVFGSTGLLAAHASIRGIQNIFSPTESRQPILSLEETSEAFISMSLFTGLLRAHRYLGAYSSRNSYANLQKQLGDYRSVKLEMIIDRILGNKSPGFSDSFWKRQHKALKQTLVFYALEGYPLELFESPKIQERLHSMLNIPTAPTPKPPAATVPQTKTEIGTIPPLEVPPPPPVQEGVSPTLPEVKVPTFPPVDPTLVEERPFGSMVGKPKE
ncbi:MAG: hypothetical protein JNK65_08330 [Deltaproteobacteria bacterium]|nr:hypothetical protein [Deltaproteobacteria bacterium]